MGNLCVGFDYSICLELMVGGFSGPPFSSSRPGDLWRGGCPLNSYPCNYRNVYSYCNLASTHWWLSVRVSPVSSLWQDNLSREGGLPCDTETLLSYCNRDFRTRLNFFGISRCVASRVIPSFPFSQREIDSREGRN